MDEIVCVNCGIELTEDEESYNNFHRGGEAYHCFTCLDDYESYGT